jgi:electron transfer flavoprotein alpha subunit
MKILPIIDNRKNKFKKADLELVYYSHLIAKKYSGTVTALVIGAHTDAGVLGEYGADEVLAVDYNGEYDSGVFAFIAHKAAVETGAVLTVLPYDSSGKPLLGMLAVKLNAGSVSGVLNTPEMEGNNFIFKKGTYSSKAFSIVKILSDSAVVTLMQNSFSPEKTGKSVAPVNVMQIDVPAPKVKVVAVEKAEGKVPLTEADIIVSGGRGLKGPENWGVLLDLAEVLGGETACSRPVSDVDWRPHSEHVGQTGIVVRPTLYVALGISGAIQHLAGVINSKVIVVVNKDPEAPFFKAADYGIIGDLFDVVPKFTEELKRFKSNA